MANYSYQSAKRVLADVARNTGGKLPSRYHDDILEWLGEGIDLLSNTNILETVSTPSIEEPKAFYTKNHVVCLPAGLMGILAVEDQYGAIIPNGGDVTDVTSRSARYSSPSFNDRVVVFEVNPLQHQTSDGTPTEKPGTSIPVYGEDINAPTPSSNGPSYYKVSGNYLQTSFEEGFVKIHYLRRVLGKDGYPMIPDNQNFRTALYWYIMMMLIGAGYRHQIFSFEY